MPPPKERRRRERLGLHWAVHLIRSGSNAPVKSETDNISSEGFYGLCPESFTAGEELECTLEIPSQTRKEKACLLLECRVRVVRVETSVPTPLFGVGFHIEDYSVMAAPRIPDSE